MKVKNKDKQKIDKSKLEKVAEAWVRLCLFNIQHKKQLTNQHKDKKYEYQAI